MEKQQHFVLLNHLQCSGRLRIVKGESQLSTTRHHAKGQLGAPVFSENYVGQQRMFESSVAASRKSHHRIATISFVPCFTRNFSACM